MSQKRDTRVHTAVAQKRAERLCSKTRYPRSAFSCTKIRYPRPASNCSKVRHPHSAKGVPERDLRVQPEVPTFKSELGDPNPHGFKTGSSDTLSTDLRDYLIKKKNVHQITPQCHCERLISAVLSYCHCGFQMTKSSIFSRSSKTSTTNSAKRRRSRKKVL